MNQQQHNQIYNVIHNLLQQYRISHQGWSTVKSWKSLGVTGLQSQVFYIRLPNNTGWDLAINLPESMTCCVFVQQRKSDLFTCEINTKTSIRRINITLTKTGWNNLYQTLLLLERDILLSLQLRNTDIFQIGQILGRCEKGKVCSSCVGCFDSTDSVRGSDNSTTSDNEDRDEDSHSQSADETSQEVTLSNTQSKSTHQVIREFVDDLRTQHNINDRGWEDTTKTNDNGNIVPFPSSWISLKIPDANGVRAVYIKRENNQSCMWHFSLNLPSDIACDKYIQSMQKHSTYFTCTGNSGTTVARIDFELTSEGLENLDTVLQILTPDFVRSLQLRDNTNPPIGRS